jgi:ABC-type iron transport system FetAB ATPase subunit
MSAGAANSGSSPIMDSAVTAGPSLAGRSADARGLCDLLNRKKGSLVSQGEEE